MGIGNPDAFFFDLVPDEIQQCRGSVVRSEFPGEMSHLVSWLAYWLSSTDTGFLRDACADRESFARGGPTLTAFFFGFFLS